MPGTENANYEVETADTARLAAEDRTAFWAEHVCRNHGALRFRFADAGAFRGRTVVQRAGERQLVDFRSDGIDYERTPLDVRRDGDETLRLLLPTSGSFVARQDDRSVAVRPGCAAVVSKARPFRLAHAADARALVLTLPAASRTDVARDARGPRTLDARAGVGAVVGTMVRALAAERETIDGTQFRLVTDTVAELLAGTDAGRGAGDGADDGTLARVDAAVREHVLRHAADPSLTPTGMARDLGWSVRQLQLALSRTGCTPSGVLRDARLDRARLLLESAAPRSVADVAYASGFRSLSVMTTHFTRRFGTTPGAYRRAHLVDPVRDRSA